MLVEIQSGRKIVGVYYYYYYYYCRHDNYVCKGVHICRKNISSLKQILR